MIKKYQENENNLRNKNITYQKYNYIKKDLEEKLYKEFRTLQEMIVNYKVLKKRGNYQGGGGKVVEGYGHIFEDLVIHQVDQMFKYILKIDTNRKQYSILQKIQNSSSRVYFFSNYKDDSKNIIIPDNKEIEDDYSMRNEVIDEYYYRVNPYNPLEEDYNNLLKQFDIKIEQVDDRKDWVVNKEIFDRIEKLIIFGFIKSSRGLLRKIHIINVYMKNQIEVFNKDIFKFIEMVHANRKYNIRYGCKIGMDKIIQMILNEYTKNDPQIRMGKKQISIYSSLVLYFLILDGKIERNLLSDEEYMEIMEVTNYFSNSKMLFKEEEMAL